jgi:DNA helicase-2/ATP-dependent DNA helicase PcrA
MILVKKEESLNERQREVSMILDGPVLVIAGAGTGKTKTLVHRMFRLVESGLSPESILLLTFTRRASLEMLSRASRLLDRRMQKVSGGTFHSFGNLFLRKNAEKIGFSSNFSILDIEDAALLLGMAREEVLPQKLLKRFPKKETLLEIISTSFNTNLSLEKVVFRDFGQYTREIKEIQEIKEKYESLKQKANCFDFDDLLKFTRDILVENSYVRDQTSAKYVSVLVDEYQDTNKVQAHIACLLASQHSNIMVVGDDAQSIYGFRGSDVRNILDFPKIFPDSKIITLQENYRSVPNILGLANAVLSKFKEKYNKELFSKKENPGLLPILIKSVSAEKEAEDIAIRILTERESGNAFSEIAVLVRSGWHTNLLELELGAKNIPYKKFGGKKFLEQAHVKDLVSYLRIFINPKDWIAWNRIILLEENVGPKQANLLLQFLQKNNIENFSERFWDSENFWLGFSRDAQTSLERLLDLVFALNQNLEFKPVQLFELVLAYYLPLLKNRFDDFEKRIQDLETIRLLAQEKESLTDFLSFLSLEPTESFSLSKEETFEDEGFVTLSTIHSAKGLEWDVVFIMHLLDGQFPSSRIRTKDELEEERRLFYVAVTRAKSKLFLTAPVIQTNKKIQLSSLSRFLNELEQSTPLWKTEEIASDAEFPNLGEKKTKTKAFEQIQTYFLN